MVRFRLGNHHIQVIDQCRPPLGSEVPGFVAVGKLGAVPAVVMAVNHEIR